MGAQSKPGDGGSQATHDDRGWKRSGDWRSILCCLPTTDRIRGCCCCCRRRHCCSTAVSACLATKEKQR